MPDRVTLTTTVTVAAAPEARSPSSQTTSVLDGAQEPWLGEAETNSASCGSWSLSCVATATAGPALVTVIV